MANANVSNTILSILGSFSSGLDVFKRLREKRKRKHSGSNGRRRRGNGRDKNEVDEEQEMRLSRSLRQGPEDIGREYARSVYAVGDGFGIGDALAQSSLAEILLKLNTGLVGIISSFLNGDRRTDLHPDYQALTQLSDRSRIDTCRTLRQLFKRMTQPRPLPAIAPAGPESQLSSNSRRNRKASPAHTKVKGPMLARVVIANSSKPSQIAMVKPSERRKKSSSSSSSELSKASSTSSTPPPEYAPEPPPRPVAVRSNTAPAVPKIGRKQMGVGSAPGLPPRREEQRQAARSTPRLQTTAEVVPAPAYEPPFLPSQTTMHALNPAAQSTPALPTRRRKQTPTYYSMASDSTRLGEIPLHKWNRQPDFDVMSLMNREAVEKGWPAGELGAGSEVDGDEGRKRGWGLRRLFGRK